MRKCLAVLTGVTLAAGTGAALADDDDVRLEDLPAAVRATVDREAKDGVIEDIERKTRNGRTVYEVEIERYDQEVKLHIDENGKVIHRRVDT